MENDGFEVVDKEMYDSMITAKIYLQEALKQDNKELRKRIEGIISMFEKAEEITRKINQNRFDGIETDDKEEGADNND